MTHPLPTGQIICPDCARASIEPMPPSASLHFYQCRGCGVILKPAPGDCCVFCSYGRPCADRQRPASGTH